MAAVIKKLPFSENREVTNKAPSGTYIVTSKNGEFFLYKQTNDGFEKLSAKGVSNPTVFDATIWGKKEKKNQEEEDREQICGKEQNVQKSPKRARKKTTGNVAGR